MIFSRYSLLLLFLLSPFSFSLSSPPHSLLPSTLLSLLAVLPFNFLLFDPSHVTIFYSSSSLTFLPFSPARSLLIFSFSTLLRFPLYFPLFPFYTSLLSVLPFLFFSPFHSPSHSSNFSLFPLHFIPFLLHLSLFNPSLTSHLFVSYS